MKYFNLPSTLAQENDNGSVAVRDTSHGCPTGDPRRGGDMGDLESKCHLMSCLGIQGKMSGFSEMSEIWH